MIEEYFSTPGRDKIVKRKKINCYKCYHFYITWEESFPFGCRRFEFKSKYFPSVEVFRASGMDCLSFEKKKFFKRIDYSV